MTRRGVPADEFSDSENPGGFNPLDFPAGYAQDVADHVITHNCAGCAIPQPDDVAEFGPGGTCAILSAIYVERSIPELTYDGSVVRCTSRVAQGSLDDGEAS